MVHIYSTTCSVDKVIHHKNMHQNKSAQNKQGHTASFQIPQKQAPCILVQPGDAEQHLLTALNQSKREKLTNNPFKFEQMNNAIGEDVQLQSQMPYHYNYQMYQNNPNEHYTYYEQPHFQSSNLSAHYPHNEDNPYRQKSHGYHNYDYQQYNHYHKGPTAHFQHQLYQQPPQQCYSQSACNPYQGDTRQSQYQQQKLEASQNLRHGKFGSKGYGRAKDKYREKQFQAKQDKGYEKFNYKGKKRSHSRSSSSSSSGQDDELNCMKKKYKQEIYQFYTNQLANLFQSRNIREHQQQKIIKFLLKKFPRFDAPIEKLKKAVEYLQGQNLIFHLSYVKVMKVSIKFDFDFNAIVHRLAAIQAKKIKKFECDSHFQANYGEEMQPMLDHHELISRDKCKVLYLVDGNNIIPAIKHFRSYQQSFDAAQNANRRMQNQVRLRYLIALALPADSVCLFFDEKFDQGEVKALEESWISSPQDKEKYNGVRVIYGGQEKADEKIVQKLRELAQFPLEKQMILVSSDRQLFVRCKQIKSLGHSGGRFFFKLLKYRGKEAYKGDKQQKKAFMAIIHGKQ